MSTRERIIEGRWSCTSCGKQGIPARFKNCPDCNNPREGGEESEFDFGGTTAAGASTQETVTDPKALELANAGADWLCAYCGTANRGDKDKCRHCGATRDGSEKEAVPDVPLQAPAPPPPAASRAQAPPAMPRRKSHGLRNLVLVAAGAAALIVWATRTHEERGVVAAKAWTRTVHREVFSRVTREGWLDELHASRPVMPVDGKGESAGVEDIRDCVTRQRGYHQVPDGRERVCHTRTRREQCGTEEKCEVKQLKNGFARETCRDVPKYCSHSYEDCQWETRYRSVPTFAQQCAYTTWEWQEAGDPSLSGTDDAPRWPDVTPGPLERQRREEQYTVTVAYEHKGARARYELHPRAEAELAAWHVGAPVKLHVSNLGTVNDATPMP